MSEVKTQIRTELKDELYAQYNWFYLNFLSAMQIACDEFFSDLFYIQLVSVSKNVNILFEGDEYFVTKIRLDKQHDVFFRNSSEFIKVVLDSVLGQSKKFKLETITQLEAKIVSSFNDYLFQSFYKFLLPIESPPKKRKNFVTIHLTMFIRDKKTGEGAKMIVSLPKILLSPVEVSSTEEKFNISDFKTSKVPVDIKVGTTKFSLKDLKNLEKEDIVVFENSDIHLMKLIHEDYEKVFRINPNPALITSDGNNNGGNNMVEQGSLSQSLWDNIQVEMGAEFEKIKITLGELKNIEQGLVVDISSVYDNKISLRVEDRVIAKGELVIVNDRYGVRIDEIFASEKEDAEQLQENSSVENSEGEDLNAVEHTVQDENAESGGEESNDEFDYSDFDLDDQDI